MEENQTAEVLPTTAEVKQAPTYEELENHVVALSERLQEYDKAYKEVLSINQQLNITNIVKRIELLFKVVEPCSLFHSTNEGFVKECAEEIVKLLSIEKKVPEGPVTETKE